MVRNWPKIEQGIAAFGAVVVEELTYRVGVANKWNIADSIAKDITKKLAKSAVKDGIAFIGKQTKAIKNGMDK